MPGCHDAMSARLIEEAGFEIGFMSGFAVSAVAARHARHRPDLLRRDGRAGPQHLPGGVDPDDRRRRHRLRQRAEHQAHRQGYASAGFACIMLEDQVAPKRCGHTEGKSVVGRDEALMRIRAAVDARNAGTDILIMARTDARACVSLDEAIARCQAFREIGADITFLEAPLGGRDATLLRRRAGPKMANLIEGGKTPLPAPAQLQTIGYTIAVYPLTMLNVSIRAMRDSARSAQVRPARGNRDGLRGIEVRRRVPGVLRGGSEVGRGPRPT